MKTARLVVAAALGAALVTAWSPAASAQGQGRNKKYVPTRAITVDAQTGTLRLPTPQETQQLVDQLAVLTNRSTDGLQTKTLPDGVKFVDLSDRFESVILARPNADGSSEVRCVTSFDEAAEFLGLVEDSAQQQ